MIDILREQPFQAFIHTIQLGSTVESITGYETISKPYVVRLVNICLNYDHIIGFDTIRPYNPAILYDPIYRVWLTT